MGNTPTPLRRAIRRNEVEEVVRILQKAGTRASALINEDYAPDCIMDSCSRVNGNAFYYAVCRNRVEILEIMLKNGADVHSIGDFGETCLHAAVRKNYVRCAKLLVENGANLWETDDHGRYAIHSAAMTLFNTSDAINFLLEAGKPEDVNLKDFAGLTPLHHAANVENIDVARVLISNGADVNAVSLQGNSPLHCAQVNGNVFRLLLENHADPELRNNDGQTASEKQ